MHRLSLRAFVPSCLRASFFDCLLVFLLSLFCYTWEIGHGPLAGTEGHRALTAHQMVQSGSYLLPRLYDQLYLKKPPLDYWIVAGFERLTGRANEWVWRFPSALAASILAAVLCACANRWFGRPAGLVPGLSHLALFAVWEQSRTADIDSMNSLFSVLAALGLIQLAIKSDGWLVTLATGLAVGAALMVKGPAGFTVIAGAVIGPAIANWQMGMLRRIRPWLAMGIGLAIFGAYALAAWHECRVEHIQPDFSGLDEAADKSLHFSNPVFILQALALPLILLVYSLPVSAALPFCLMGPIWSDTDETRRRAVRSLVGALMVGAIVAVLSGMTNPRYGYVMLPLLCPLAGAVVAAVKRGDLGRPARDWVAGILKVAAVGFFGLAVGVGIAGWGAAEAFDHYIILAVMPCSAFGAIIYLRRQNAIALAALIVMAAFPLAVLFTQDRERRSSYPAAMKLAEIFPAGTVITCGQIPMDQPELFYYAKMRVESYPTKFATPLALPGGGRWVILTRDEFASWSKTPGNGLSGVVELWPERRNAYLAWYEGEGR